MATVIKTWTIEDLLAMPDDGMRHELVRGELIEMGRPGNRHGRLQLRVGRLLAEKIEDSGLGSVVTDVGAVITREPATVLGPDVAVYLGRAGSPLDEPEGYLDTLPDVVVEIVSPGDSASEVDDKTHLYLDAGVRMVIAVWPKRRAVTVAMPDGITRDYAADDVVDLSPVVPELTIPVGAIFSGMGANG